MLGQFQRRGSGGIGNRNHHVDVVIRPLALDAVAQLAAHLHPGAVDIGTVEHGIGPRQVDVLEDARGQPRLVGAHLRMDVLVHVDEDRLARRQVPHQLEAGHIERHRLGGDHHVLALGRLTRTVDDRTNAVGIAKRHQPEAVDDRHGGVTPAAAPVNAAQRIEDILRRQIQSLLAQFVREHVEQHLGVRAGIDMAQIGGEQLLLELIGVGQVAVVGQGDAVGRIDIERLGFGLARRTGGRVADMTDAHIALQPLHVTRMEHVPYQPVVLAQQKATFIPGHHAGGILSAVLQDRQRVIDQLIDRFIGHEAYDTAHADLPRLVAPIQGAGFSAGTGAGIVTPCPS